MNSMKIKIGPKDQRKADRRIVGQMVTAIWRRIAMLSLLCALVATAAQIAGAQTESTLYSFCSLPNCADGSTPAPNLLWTAQGNLYGVAEGGTGNFGGGVVFELNLAGTETLIYSFSAINQGLGPNGGLIQDSAGNLYGSTAGGGYDHKPCKKLAGCGLVYKLTNGAETVLYDFLGSTDGDEPNGALVLDKQGNLYGTTYAGGGGGGGAEAGTIFKVSPTGTETVVHRFGAVAADGKFPNAGLVMDKKGNLYGTTIYGGIDGDYGPGLMCHNKCGVVFELTAAGVEKVLYAFQGSEKRDGAAPFAGLILDSKGNLYGTTFAGGLHGQGTVFKLTPTGQETVLYSFGLPPDAGFPVGRLVMDAQGNLYGATAFGGTHGQGTVFKLTPSNQEKVLYSFTGGADGGSPLDGLAMDPQGNLYGTTFVGGIFNNQCLVGCGVVFKVTP